MEGVANQVSLAKETTLNTPVTPTISIPVRPSDGLRVNQEYKAVQGINTKPGQAKRFYLGKQNFQGGYELDAYPQALGYFFNSALGPDTPTLLEAGAYAHVFSDSITKASYTVEEVIGAQSKRIAGVVFDGFKFSVKAGEDAVLQVTGMGMSQADSTKISATYETNRPFTFADITALSINGTDIKAKVSSFELDYANGNTQFTGMGSKNPATRYVKQSTCKGKISLYLDSTTKAYFTNVINQTEGEVILTFTGDVLGASHNYLLTFDMKQVNLQKYETKLDFDYNAIDLTFEAREDVTNGLLTVTLNNSLAAY